VGKTLARSAAQLGANHVIPFSSFHRYRRTDSVWAEQYTTPITAYPEGFELPGAEVLPPFVRVDCESGTVQPIEPPLFDATLRSPEACGDNWNDRLTNEDRNRLRAYFAPKRLLHRWLGFLQFRVGGDDFTVDFNRSRRAGITFEVPRNSLMTAVTEETFDDLLIGNFMKTTLHGINDLYPYFTPPVAKYGDNGRVQSRSEVLRYFAHYLLRNPLGLSGHEIETQASFQFHLRIPKDARFFGAAKRAYYFLKSR